MAQNQAALSVYLQEILFGEKEILKNVEAREHIFELRDKSENSLGFVSMYDLKAYIFENEIEAGEFEVKNIDQTSWTPIFEHTFFQRRRPQLISAAILNEDDDQKFFILKQGQKTGPFEKKELVSKLEEKSLLLTDMISYNGGHTWMKLYQVENFDRRTLNESEQLPGIPSEIIMESNDAPKVIKPVTDAITNLAYLSNIKRGKSVEKEKNLNLNANQSVRKGSVPLIKWLFMASVFAIGYFLFSIYNQLNSPFTQEKNTVGEQSQMLTPVEMPMTKNPAVNPTNNYQNNATQNGFNQINDQRRNVGKFETRSLPPIVPQQRKSFMETAQYQEIKNNEVPAAEEDPNYYYDNTAPMELDPVRSQISKENYETPPMVESEGPIPSNDATFENEVSN